MSMGTLANTAQPFAPTFAAVDFTREPLASTLALASLFPVFFLVFATGAVVARRELAGFFSLIGFVVNLAVNVVLKRLLRDRRPADEDLGTLDSLESAVVETRFSGVGVAVVGSGNPSNHAQFCSFMCVFVILFLFVRVRTMGPGRNWLRFAIGALAVAVSSVVCWGRVYLGCHSWTQVFNGLFVGAVVATCWFLLLHSVFSPHVFPRVVRWRVCQLFYLRDSSALDNVLSAEAELHFTSGKTTHVD